MYVFMSQPLESFHMRLKVHTQNVEVSKIKDMCGIPMARIAVN